VALKSDGTLMAWGLNNYGQLGNGSTTNSSNPVAVLGISDAVAVSAGLDHNIAIKSDGTVMTWGWNQHGQLGDGTTTDKSTPVSVPGLNLL
jgi:alpha-tubulin suppressor-like RCC1 family protein